MRKNLKIIAACQDVGGCNAIYPVVCSLRASGYKVNLYASSYSAKMLKKKNAGFREIEKKDFDNVHAIFDGVRPDIVLLGTSLGFSLEDALVEESRKRRIKTIAVFDSWFNYSLRFTDTVNRKNLRYLPDYICVSDDFVQAQMQKENIPEERIVVTGNPYFDDLGREAKKYTRQDKSKLLARYGVSADTVVVSFFSQAIDKSFGTDSRSKSFLGYTQFEALKILLSALKKFNNESKILLIIRPHPKEAISAYAEFSQDNGYLRVAVSNREEPRKIIALSDIVCGMFSLMLVEAYLMKRNILSIQPNLKVENPLILSRLGLIKSLENSREVLRKLKLFMKNKRSVKIRNFLKTGKSTRNVVDLISGVIQNQ